MTTHRRAAILSMGDELTLGQKLDTNGKWIAERLVDRGIVPVEHVTVPDDMDATVAALRRLASGVDLIVSSGGLGPTADDLTRHAVAMAGDDTLIEDAGARDQIERYFQERGREMPTLNLVQALRPSRARSLRNDHGTAPGICAKIGGCDVYCLPGPPREMTPMFLTYVAPSLRTDSARSIAIRTLHCFGIGESDIAARLGGMMDRARSPLVGTTASGGVVSVRIRYEGNFPESDAQQLVDESARRASQACSPFVFGSGEQSLPSVVLDSLRRHGQTLAVAESCTGGMLGEMITGVPGSSDSFIGGWITYSNEMKMRELGVIPVLISTHGAVSRDVATSMAAGALFESGADHALAITGIAGPGGGTEQKPVGTVWVALVSKPPSTSRTERAQAAQTLMVDARQFRMGNDRQSIREWSSRAALMMLWMRLAGVAVTPLLRQMPD